MIDNDLLLYLLIANSAAFIILLFFRKTSHKPDPKPVFFSGDLVRLSATSSVRTVIGVIANHHSPFPVYILGKNGGSHLVVESFASENELEKIPFGEGPWHFVMRRESEDG